MFNFLRFENGVILWCIWLSFFQKIQRIAVNDDLLSKPKNNMTEIRVRSETVVYLEVFCSYHKIGDPIAVMSAMKMETIVTATMVGVVEEVAVQANESLSAGDLIARIKK